MKRLMTLVLLLWMSICIWAQKPVIDSSTFSNWARVNMPKISNDGKFAMYTIEHTRNPSSTLIIQGISNFSRQVVDESSADNAFFSEDSKTVVYIKQNDTLVIQSLTDNQADVIAGVSELKVPPKGFTGILAYRKHDSSGAVCIKNIRTGVTKSFPNISTYLFDPNGRYLLLSVNGQAPELPDRLQLITLTDFSAINIWEGKGADNLIFDDKDRQIAFTAKHASVEDGAASLWHYTIGENRAVELFGGYFINERQQFVLGTNELYFSKDGKKIFLRLNPFDSVVTTSTDVQLEVWGYKDHYLQSDLHLAPNSMKNHSFLAIIHIDTKALVKLENYDDELLSAPGEGNDEYVLIKHIEGPPNEWSWNPLSEPVIYVVSTVDGTRKVVTEKGAEEVGLYQISPDARFVVYYRLSRHNYFSYEIATGITKNLTQDIRTEWSALGWDRPRPASPVGIAGWYKDGSSVLIYDQFDIWRIDPAVKVSPVNMTNGYGKANMIQFHFADNEEIFDHNAKSPIILQALSLTNKNTGFYTIKEKSTEDPKLLSMGPYDYGFFWGIYFKPMKAKGGDLYIVQRQSAAESPNYFLTKDFKSFAPLSSVYPEKKFNWLTTELIEWTTFDGSKSQAVLYKPENFDPQKKYPVIFYFYQQLTNDMNLYIGPAASTAIINIPYYISNGYIVCTPDIHYKVGMPGESAYNAVASLAKFLSLKSWVDSSRMGIQGHSFGGYEVDYIITRTTIFKAAMSGSGMSDFVSGYGQVILDGNSSQYYYESDQNRLGATPWSDRETYIRNSPIFFADKVSTPLLMMTNPEDINVPPAHGIEFFLALRRLQKKVWMLEYTEGQHILILEKDKLDFTIRMKQFFDYYLKDSLPPKWMTEGIPARLRGKESGLDLDSSGVKP